MLALYIHTPFCVRKCTYCGFYSTSYTAHSADEYLLSLEREAAGLGRTLSDRLFSTVYFGGGTPAVFSLRQLDVLLSLVSRFFRIEAGAERTVEANPNCVSMEKLALLRDRGITRLSLGVQSLSDPVLSFLGRTHTATQAVETFRLARNSGFDAIGIDLIYGVPGQTDGQWHDTLNRVVSLGPEHVSAYNLSLDEGSLLKAEVEAGRVRMPDDDTVVSQYEAARSLLRGAGYEQYEISNFCLPGQACRHNSHYWQRGEYLGLGPGAWSFIQGRRYRNIPDIREYCLRISRGLMTSVDEERPDDNQAANETVMLALRTTTGLNLEQYTRDYGARRTRELLERADSLRHAGLIELVRGRLRLSDRAFSIANEVLVRLFS